jgi:hypothetical protein
VLELKHLEALQQLETLLFSIYHNIMNNDDEESRTFINETTGTWSKGDLCFGFNITRAFTIRKPKEFRGVSW